MAVVAGIQKTSKTVDDLATCLTLIKLTSELLVRQVHKFDIAVDNSIEVTVKLR